MGNKLTFIIHVLVIPFLTIVAISFYLLTKKEPEEGIVVEKLVVNIPEGKCIVPANPEVTYNTEQQRVYIRISCSTDIIYYFLPAVE